MENRPTIDEMREHCIKYACADCPIGGRCVFYEALYGNKEA